MRKNSLKKESLFLKRLVRKASKEQVSKAKELCKAIKFALEKNDRNKLLELKDEISLYHP